MQYTNRQNIYKARTVLKGVFGLLAILFVVAFMGDYAELHKVWPLIGVMLLFVAMLSAFGGFDELLVSVGQGYIEVDSRPFVEIRKGGRQLISADASRLISVKYTRFMFLRYVRLRYMSHSNKEKTVTIGLTFMGSIHRRELLRDLKIICKNNNYKDNQ
ncbi:MAG: hypothetical protein MJZ01_06735 [Bacteroidales bacterium]|nr:hypothetical protein [Bacteroidales bacterium]